MLVNNPALFSYITLYSGYLDRTIAHELTHAVMAANITGFNKLPDSITEGSAELAHGIDDFRRNNILTLAYASNSEVLFVALTNNSAETDHLYEDSYSGGYMLLRYFAKQVAEYWNGESMSQYVGMLASSETDTGCNLLNVADLQFAILDFADVPVADSLMGM